MRGNGKRGAAMVEGALVFAVTIFFIIGIMDFGRLIFSYNLMAYSVQQAARYAAVHGSSSKNPATLATIDAIAKATMIGAPASSVSTVVTWTPNKDPGSKVTVQLTCSFQPMVQAITFIANPLNLKSTATLTILN